MPIFILLVLSAAFFTGVYRLFVMRFEAGDIYPVYSSLRADPLGTEIFFDSLAESGIKVSRNYTPDYEVPGPSAKTLFLIGEPWYSLDAPEETAESLDEAVASGCRLVVLLYPEGPAGTNGAKWDGQKQKFKIKNKNTPAAKKDIYAGKRIDLLAHWGVRLGNDGVIGGNKTGMAGPPVAHSARARETATAGLANGLFPGLPARISWHSDLFFGAFNKGWKIIYTINEKYPVMMVRRFGAGQIVVATDSYAASNEAMFRERHPRFLSFLVGGHKTAVFDESHFGIVKNPGVTTLLLEYHLGGLMAGFLLLGALFVWKNASSLVPPGPGAGDDGRKVQGIDNISGLMNLLKRNIPPSGLIKACYSEWDSALSSGPGIRHKKSSAIRAFISEGGRGRDLKKDPVEAYKKIEKLITLERGKRT